MSFIHCLFSHFISSCLHYSQKRRQGQPQNRLDSIKRVIKEKRIETNMDALNVWNPSLECSYLSTCAISSTLCHYFLSFSSSLSFSLLSSTLFSSMCFLMQATFGHFNFKRHDTIISPIHAKKYLVLVLLDAL